MTEKGQVKITTAKPIVGKKVFYFINRFTLKKAKGRFCQLIVQTEAQSLVASIKMSKHNKVACLKNQAMSTQSI